MDLSFLAAKQKRLQEWEKELNRVTNAEFRNAVSLDLAGFRAVLFQIWEAGGCKPEDMMHLTDLERRLEQQFEEVRLLSRAQ